LYRVNLPPLRERGEDVVELAERYLEHLGRRHRLPGRKLSEGARRRIRSHAWPGNVRELAHELERALVFEEAEVLDLPQLPGGGQESADETTVAGCWFNLDFTFPEQGFDLEASIQFLIQRALRQTDGNVSAAARLLGVSRDYVRYRLAGQKRQLGNGN
jgi:DNA-binding NtrC family response regulator